MERPRSTCPAVPLGWELFLGREAARNRLVWALRPSPGGELPPSSRRLLQDRIRRYSSLYPDRDCRWSSFQGGGEGLALPLVEGERLESYLSSVPRLAPATFGALLRDVVAEMTACLEMPHVLWHGTAEDFLVTVRHGVSLRVRFVPEFRLLQGFSEFDPARLPEHCLGIVLGLVKRLEEGGEIAGGSRLRRALLKLERKFRAGQTGGVEDLLGVLDRILARYAERVARRETEGRERFALREDHRPAGMVAERVVGGATRIYPERLPLPHPERPRASFSSFVLPARNGSEARTESERLAYLLPPEEWLLSGAVNGLNSRIVDPKLREMSGIPRLRSVFAEEEFTAAFGDPDCGVPLPSYLFLVKLPETAVIAILDRILDTLDRIEPDPSAEDLPLSGRREGILDSPWQVQLHRLSRHGEGAPKNRRERPFWERPLGEWSGWRVKLRLELPTEAMIAEGEMAWDVIRERFAGKFLPALACWMLGFDRFDIVRSRRELESTALHPDVGINALFEASVTHFRDDSSDHRARFLSLLAEGLEMARRQSGERREVTRLSCRKT